MDLIAQRRVFDIFTRQAFFIEMVKADETRRLDVLLRAIDADFRKHLSKITYGTLDELSKAQVKAFIRALRVSQTRIYSQYQQELIDRLNAFMKAVTVQTVIAGASVVAHTDDPEAEELAPVKELTFAQALPIVEQQMKENGSNSLFGFLVLGGTAAAFAKLWSKIINSPLPSSGALIINTVNTAIASAMVSTENAVYKAWANKMTIAELIREVVNFTEGKTAPGGTSSVSRKIRNGLNGTLATIFQQIGQQSSNAAASTLWPAYLWVSVLDERTSAICRERDGNIYIYGKGPLPPAHPFCRSHVIPTDDGELIYKIPSLFEWLKMQPRAFLRAAFGDTLAAKFDDGTIRASDFEKFKVTKSLTIAEFVKRTGDLI